MNEFDLLLWAQAKLDILSDASGGGLTGEESDGDMTRHVTLLADELDRIAKILRRGIGILT